MSDTKDLIENFGSLLDLNEIEIFMYLIIFLIIVWLYKELKKHQEKELEGKEKSVTDCIKLLSEISFFAQYNRKDINFDKEFSKLIYNSYPYIDYILMKKIKAIQSDSELDEEQKIAELISVCDKAIDELIYKKRRILRSNSLVDRISQFFISFTRIIQPLFFSIVITFTAVFFMAFLIMNTGNANSFWPIIKVVMLFASVTQSIILNDMITVYKESIASIISYVFSIICALSVTFINHWSNWLFLLFWMIFLITAFYLQNRKKT